MNLAKWNIWLRLALARPGADLGPASQFRSLGRARLYKPAKNCRMSGDLEIAVHLELGYWGRGEVGFLEEGMELFGAEGGEAPGFVGVVGEEGVKDCGGLAQAAVFGGD